MIGFNKRLKLIRENKKMKDPKWTQEYVADAIGVARPTYTAYENGIKQPPLETVNKIADLFETNVDYLLGRTDDPAPPSDGVELSERELLLKELEQYGNLFFQGGGEDLSDDELREIVRAMRDAAQTAAKNTYNVISKYKKK